MGFELLLPVVLFILTLIIIFLLRSDDKRNQRMELIRKRSEALLRNVENSQTQFNELVQKVEERISKKIDESHLLMSNVDSQLTDLEARSEDLAALQKVLLTYQTSLTQLESTTAQVEQRAAVMREEVANLSRVQESLMDFDLRFEQFQDNLGRQIAEGEENMRVQHLRVKEMQSASFAKLQEYEKEVQQAEQDNLAQIAIHTETLKDRQEASLNLVSLQATKLRQLGEEGDQQMHRHEKALQAAYKQANEKLQEQQREFALLQAKHAEQQKKQKLELLAIEEAALNRIAGEMQIFVQQCHGEMAKIFDMTLKKTDVSFQNMIKVVSEYLKQLALRLEQARDATRLLDASEGVSLQSFKDELSTLLQKTAKGEQNLERMQDLENKATASLTSLYQETQQLQESLESMKSENLALLKGMEFEKDPQSVVFVMALDKPLEAGQASAEKKSAAQAEPLKGQEQKAEPVVDENLPSVPFAMALSEEGEDGESQPKQGSKNSKGKKEVGSAKTEQAPSERRKIEYLSESEEEIILDDDDEAPIESPSVLQ